MSCFIKPLCMLVLVLLNACAKPPELNAPCPDYGRFCIQSPVNESLP